MKANGPLNLTALCAGALLAASTGLLTDTAHAAPQRPNFLFILTDDQRHDALGVVNPLVQTPHMDALAQRSVRFSNAFVTLSICSPSRAACLTGAYGSRNGVMAIDSSQRIKNGFPTFASLLGAAGYATGIAGKWHLPNNPKALGFDFARYFYSNGTYYNRQVEVGGKKTRVPGFIDNWVADQSIGFMEKAVADKKPFVMWMCTQVPHMDNTMDWNVRPEALQLYESEKMPVPATWNDDLSGKPPYLKTSRSRTQALLYGYDKREGIQRHRQRYLAAVTEVDGAIGKALNALRDLKIEDNTVVILMGDNGWFIGEHGFTSKVLPYEDSMRVPMIVAAPGMAPGVDEHLVLNIDLPATMLQLAGVEAPPEMQGRSLLPLLRREKADWRDSVYYEAPLPQLGSHPLQAVRTARWKYVRTYQLKDQGKLAFEELYDLQNDPQEMKNLGTDAAHAATLRAMSELLAAQKEKVRAKAQDAPQNAKP